MNVGKRHMFLSSLIGFLYMIFGVGWYSPTWPLI
jgi:hypothetical protein